MSIEWADPPPRGRYAPIVRELQANAGRWCVVDQDIPETSTYGWRRLKQLGAQVRCKYHGSRMDVYARWPE